MTIIVCPLYKAFKASHTPFTVVLPLIFVKMVLGTVAAMTCMVMASSASH